MKNKEYWMSWIVKAGIRALKTVAQSGIATIGVASAAGEVDWVFVVSTAAVAGLISLLTSIQGLPELQVETEE